MLIPLSWRNQQAYEVVASVQSEAWQGNGVVGQVVIAPQITDNVGAANAQVLGEQQAAYVAAVVFVEVNQNIAYRYGRTGGKGVVGQGSQHRIVLQGEAISYFLVGEWVVAAPEVTVGTVFEYHCCICSKAQQSRRNADHQTFNETHGNLPDIVFGAISKAIHMPIM